MKKYRDSKILLAVIVVGCGRALAAGGERDQGTLMAGQGLDWQRSGTLLQPAQEAQALLPAATAQAVIPFSSTKGDYTVNEAELSFAEPCTRVADHVVRCSVLARKSSKDPKRPDTQLCGYWLGANKRIWVYLIDGRPDGAGGFTFGLGQGESAFVACSVANEKNPDEWEWKALGAVGKCLLWQRPENLNLRGFPPSNADRGKEFNACLRAVRADYCGYGVTHTIDGTRIDLYGVKEDHKVTSPFLLEATWNERGAICIIHARWMALSPTCQGQFGRVLGRPPPKGKQKGKEAKGGTTERDAIPSATGTEYHCDLSRLGLPETDGSCEAERGFTAKALSSWILADDSLLQ